MAWYRPTTIDSKTPEGQCRWSLRDQPDGKDENKLDDEDGSDAEGSVESGSGQDEGGDLATKNQHAPRPKVRRRFNDTPATPPWFLGLRGMSPLS